MVASSLIITASNWGNISGVGVFLKSIFSQAKRAGDAKKKKVAIKKTQADSSKVQLEYLKSLSVTIDGILKILQINYPRIYHSACAWQTKNLDLVKKMEVLYQTELDTGLIENAEVTSFFSSSAKS